MKRKELSQSQKRLKDQSFYFVFTVLINIVKRIILTSSDNFSADPSGSFGERPADEWHGLAAVPVDHSEQFLGWRTKFIISLRFEGRYKQYKKI